MYKFYHINVHKYYTYVGLKIIKTKNYYLYYIIGSWCIIMYLATDIHIHHLKEFTHSNYNQLL